VEEKKLMEVKLEKEPLKISTLVGEIELFPFSDVLGYCIKIAGNDGVEIKTIEELPSHTIVAIHKIEDDDESEEQHSESNDNNDFLIIEPE
jgi:hypothetical protein